MFQNAAIIGVGQSAYTRRPEPGQTALHLHARRGGGGAEGRGARRHGHPGHGGGVVLARARCRGRPRLEARACRCAGCVQDTNGGSSAMNMLGHALRGVETGAADGDPGARRRRHRARRLRQGRGELQHRDAEASGAARPRRAERRLCAGGEPPDEEIRAAEIRLRPHRRRAARMGGEESLRGLSHAADDGGVSRRADGRRSAVALRLRAGGRGRAGDHRGASRSRAEGPAGRAGAGASRAASTTTTRRATGSRPASAPSPTSCGSEAGVQPDDIDVASIYDDYPTMVLAQLNDLGLIPDNDLATLLPRDDRRAALSGQHLGRHAVAPASRAASPAA